MGRKKMKPGTDSIDTVKVTMHGDGTRSIEWRIRLPNGQMQRHVTRADCNNGELRRMARATAADLLATSSGSGKWKPSSAMDDYVLLEVIPAVRNAPLRPNTQRKYVRLLDIFAGEVSGFTIADAVRPSNIEATLGKVAMSSGTATAKQVRKVVGKYVMQSLVREEVIAHNPLREFNPVLPEHVGKAKPAGGQALSHADRVRVIERLLAIDPEDTPAPKRGHYTKAQRVAKRRLVIDVTLLQACTGLRISEVRLMTRGDVDEKASPMTVTVTEEVSKTHRGRVVPIMDARVEDRVRERLAVTPKDPDTIVFCAPATPGRVWDMSNAEKAVRKLYHELADDLGIPLLNNVSSHVWRETLNSEWMQKGVPDAVRSAYFGHSSETNRQYYTDVTDISGLVDRLREGKDDSGD